MRKKLLWCGIICGLMMFSALSAGIPTQVWGNGYDAWHKLLTPEMSIQRCRGPLPPIPQYPATKLAVWAHQGRLTQRFKLDQLQQICSYVKQGGVLVISAELPPEILPINRKFDLTPALPLLGATRFFYSYKIAVPTPLGRAVLGDLADRGNWYAQKRAHGVIGGLCGLKVLLGSAQQAELGVLHLGKGAVVVHSGRIYFKPDEPYALMMKKTVQTVLKPELLDRYFPFEPSNAAVTVAGKPLHVSFQIGHYGLKAANFLQDKFKAITGKKNFAYLYSAPQYIIHVGETPYVKSLKLDFQSLHPFGYYMVCRDGRNLVLAGKTRAGNMYAVSDFLKRYAGYRNFGKLEIFKVIPRLETVKLPAKLEIREEPDVNSYILAWGQNQEFGRNSRLNAMATHALSELVPKKLYGKTHPEYFPMINGKRLDMTRKHTGPWNPCLSNPDLPHLVELYAEKYFKRYPDRIALPLGVNDGGGDCQCPQCQAKWAKYGNLYVEFYNLAARVVARKHPGKLVAFIAYGSKSSPVPRNITMEPNVLVEVVSTVQNGKDVLGEWQKVGAQHFGIYDYLYAMGGGMVVPQYYPHLMGQHWKKLHQKYHLTSLWLEYYPRLEWMEAARQYVLDTLAWDMDADIDALLDDYFRSMFENLAPEIRAFFDHLETIYCRNSQPYYPMRNKHKPRQMEVYQRADLAKLDALLQQAAQKPASPMVKRRLGALTRVYTMSRCLIVNYICTREIRAIKAVDSLAKCRKILALTREAYTAIDQLQNLNYSAAEQQDMFNRKDGMKNFYGSQLRPIPWLEGVADPQIMKITRYLKAHQISAEQFYREELAKCALPTYQGLVATQIYLLHHQPVNLVRNASFEMVKNPQLPAQPKMSDHKGLKNIPYWYSWTFPSSVTEFGISNKLAHTGQKCGYIGQNQAGGSFIHYARLKANCRYRVGVWVNRNRGNIAFRGCGRISIRMQGKRGWLDLGAATKREFTEECENKWVFYDTTFTAPDEDGATALILIGAPQQAPDVRTYIDDVTLEMIYDPGAEKKKQKNNAVIQIKAPQNPAWVQLNTAVATARKLIARAGAKLPNLQVELVLQNRGADGAFDFTSEGQRVTITGNEEGLRCGLYTLLQTLGIHWFSPHDDWVFPAAKVAFDPAVLNGHHAPDFSYRGLHICSCPNQFEERLGQWMSYNRMNRKLTHLPSVPVIGAELKKLGLKPDTTVHAYSEFIPEKKYFATHPEYFALISGKRTPYSKEGQLCLSNLQMRAAFCRELLAVLRANPELGVIGICPQDGFGHCECPACRALDTPEDRRNGRTVNGRVADFVQDMCARVAKAAPGRMLGHYSYSNFSKFMDELSPAPENLLISYTIGHCTRHALNDAQCPLNRAALENLKNIRHKVRHVYIYDYYGYRWGKMPAPYLPAQEKDFQLWKKMGIDGFMTEVVPSDRAYWEGLWPATYYASRLLWNADYSYPAAIRDWCQACYGTAASAMSDYFMALQRGGQEMPGCFKREAHNFAEILTPQVRSSCRRAIEKANKLEPKNPLVQKETRLFEYWCQNLALREKYRTAREITARPWQSAGFQPQQVHLVEWATQVPDLANNTEVEVAADKDHIRFRLTMHETRMANLRWNPKRVLASDNIELFLNDGKDPLMCYHFIVDSHGRFMASACKKTTWNWNWVHHATFKAQRLPAAWKLEIIVPKRDINAQKEFSFTVIRNRYAGGQWTVLGAPNGGAFFKPVKYIKVR